MPDMEYKNTAVKYDKEYPVGAAIPRSVKQFPYRLGKRCTLGRHRRTFRMLHQSLDSFANGCEPRPCRSQRPPLADVKIRHPQILFRLRRDNNAKLQASRSRSSNTSSIERPNP